MPQPGGRRGFWLVYEASRKSRTRYVGITRNFARRCRQHMRGRLSRLGFTRSSIRALGRLPRLANIAARRIEQVLIGKHGIISPARANINLDTKQNPGPEALLNRRNEIAAGDRDRYCAHVSAGRATLTSARYRSRATEPFMRRRTC